MYAYKVNLFPADCQCEHEIAAHDLQSGELAHVGEGRVGQRVDLVVAQVSGRKKTLKGHKLAVLMYTVRRRRRTGENLHQLEVFEGRQFLWHDAELVSIQIPEQGGTNTSVISLLTSKLTTHTKI